MRTNWIHVALCAALTLSTTAFADTDDQTAADLAGEKGGFRCNSAGGLAAAPGLGLLMGLGAASVLVANRRVASRR